MIKEPGNCLLQRIKPVDEPTSGEHNILLQCWGEMNAGMTSSCAGLPATHKLEIWTDNKQKSTHKKKTFFFVEGRWRTEARLLKDGFNHELANLKKFPSNWLWQNSHNHLQSFRQTKNQKEKKNQNFANSNSSYNGNASYLKSCFPSGLLL